MWADRWRHQLTGPTDPARDAGWREPPPRKGFFTDTSICIGCKACEVACKEWNRVPERQMSLSGHSYDNTGQLGADTWRHVAFIEQNEVAIARARESGRRLVDLGMPGVRDAEPQVSTRSSLPRSTNVFPTEYSTQSRPASTSEPHASPSLRWLMSSDVCKHCTHAGCLDVCPTGALFRSEFGTVVVQPDVCNGCGYCVAACPFGVIGRRDDGVVQVTSSVAEPAQTGIAQKCTLCYDRLTDGQNPACAKACPTTSISFGDHDAMVARARERLATLHAQGFTEARLYGANPDDGVGGTGSVFLLMDDPEVYGLPPDPVVPTEKLSQMFQAAGWAGTVMIGAVAAIFAGFGLHERGRR